MSRDTRKGKGGKMKIITSCCGKKSLDDIIIVVFRIPTTTGIHKKEVPLDKMLLKLYTDTPTVTSDK